MYNNAFIEMPLTNMSTSDEAFFRLWHTLRQVPRHPNKASVQDIATGLAALGVDVSVRTIQRDLLDLARLFPIIVDDRSRPYGWSWARNAKCYELPGLSSDEALLWVLAERHLKHLLPQDVLEYLSPMFRAAHDRLNSEYKDHGKTSWPDKVRVVFSGQPLIPPNVDYVVQRVVMEALLEGKQLEVQYRKKNEIETVEYRIHPLAMVSRGAVIYLYARISDYPDLRNLVMHRIVKASKVDLPVVPPENYDLDGAVENGVWGFGSGNKIELLLRCKDGKGEHLKETPLSTHQYIEDHGGGCVTVKATVADTPQLRWWILGLGAGVEVLEPDSLRQDVSREIVRMGLIYSKAH